MRPPIDNGFVLITSASSGMGYEIARQIASEASAFVLVARRIKGLKELAAELRAQHPCLDVRSIACDVAEPAAVDRLVGRVHNEIFDARVKEHPHAGSATAQTSVASICMHMAWTRARSYSRGVYPRTHDDLVTVHWMDQVGWHNAANHSEALDAA